MDRYWPTNESRSWSMESQEGKNSNLSDASSAKYDIQVGPALWASCAKNRFFFPVPQQLGRNEVLPGNHGFFSFRHWLLVEPLEWNEIRISWDLSSPLTRNRLSLCRKLLPNGIPNLFLDLQRRLTPPTSPSLLRRRPFKKTKKKRGVTYKKVLLFDRKYLP